MQTAISEIVNKKTGGGTSEGGTIAEGERWSFRKAVIAKETADSRRQKGRTECVTEQTAHWDFFS